MIGVPYFVSNPLANDIVFDKILKEVLVLWQYNTKIETWMYFGNNIYFPNWDKDGIPYFVLVANKACVPHFTLHSFGC